MSWKSLGVRSALVLFALSAACGDDMLIDPSLDPKGVIAIFDAPDKTILTPYPSDRYTVEAPTKTGRRLALSASESPDLVVTAGPETLKELDQTDGFSTTGGVIAEFDGPIDVTGIALRSDEDPATVAPLRDASSYTAKDSPLLLVDVDDASPERGKAIGLVPRYWEQPKDDYYTTDEFTLIAQPAVPLRPRTRYLFVVTDLLAAADGGEIHRSPLTDDLISGRLATPYGDEVRTALDVLEESIGVGRERVVLATAFTTASALDGMIDIATQNRAAPSPELTEPWTIETPLQDDGRIRYRAVYGAPEWRTPLPDARFVTGDNGHIVKQGTAGLEVFMAVSDANTATKRIPVIYGHGLGGDKDGCWGTAARLSSLGVAVFAIDSPYHGARSQGGSSGTAIFRFFGIEPSSGEFVMGRARDNFRQMGSDQLELVRLIDSLATLDILPPGAPDGIPDLDTSRILYIGHSFGSVQGPLVASLAPEITTAVWNVGGDNLTMMLRDSGLFSVLVNSFKPIGTSDGAVARFFAVTQGIIDPGDPLNYARFVALEPLVDGWTPRDVLLQEVIDDGIVPNSTSEALARAAGLTNMNPLRSISGLPEATGPLSANLATGSTGVISQFDKVEGGVRATHGELIFSPEGRAQYVEFFRTAIETGRATAPPAYP